MVNRLYVNILTFFYKFIDSCKGTAHVSEIFKNNTIIGTLEIDLHDKYHIKLYCRRRQYLRRYERSLLKGSIHTVFDLYASLGHEASPRLKEACAITVTFPPLVPLFVDQDTHVKLLFNAYLDIIKHRLSVG